MSEPFYTRGLKFECQRCSHCCRHEPGYVYVSRGDILTLSGYLNMPKEQFIMSFCRTVQRNNSNVFSLIEKANFDCIFWEEGGCRVYEVRPFQCRSYPFWESFLVSEEAWRSLEDSCPGVNSGVLHNYEEIERWKYLRSLEDYHIEVEIK